MRNAEIADAFDELADRLALTDEKPYRYMAYRKAATNFRELTESLQLLNERGAVRELPGVGPAIEEKVRDLLSTGTFPALERARADVPDAMLALTKVPGIGTKTAQKIFAVTDGEDIDSLLGRAAAGTLEAGDGITAKVVAQLAEEAARRASGAADAGDVEGIPLDPEGAPLPGSWMRRDQAEALLHALIAELPPAATDAAPAAAYARGAELVRGVTVLATAADPAAAATAVGQALRERGFDVDATDAPRGLSSTAVHVAGTSPAGLPSLIVLTSAASRAADASLLAGPDGWTEFAASNDRAVDVPIELRERVLAGTLDLANIPPRLIVETDLRGDLHAHSTWSDGRASILDMARTARSRGDEYWCVTDHSAPYAMVGGLGDERLREQAEEVAATNDILAAEHAAGDAPAFRVLHGSEVEILADGSLGLPDDVLERLDWVVASIHVAQRQTEEQLIERMRRVAENPLVDAIGHPTSRRLLRRKRTALPIEVLIDLAREHDLVLEINANPDRLDLDSTHAALALAAGVRLTVNTDAHQTATLALRSHGVAIARRAAARREDVVNCLTADELLATRRRLRVATQG